MSWMKRIMEECPDFDDIVFRKDEDLQKMGYTTEKIREIRNSKSNQVLEKFLQRVS